MTGQNHTIMRCNCLISLEFPLRLDAYVCAHLTPQSFDKSRRPILRSGLRVVPQVLRFYCIWDDRQRLFGDRQPFRLHYFLEDDTVEILEEPANNSGRDPFPIFLRRTPLPQVCRAGQRTHT